ncbi:NAD-binding protein, partial [Desulfobacterales bacterium HSG16]|nr:NAD-binding protein [Desulfobacterales bacterium HSG16]
MVGQDSGEELSGHVVICNCNDKVRVIVEELHNDATHKPLDVVLIVQDEDLWDKNPEWHPRIDESSETIFKVLFGYPTDLELLQSAGIQKARAAVILADPNHGLKADAPSTLTAIAIEKQNPQVHTVMDLILSVN